MLKKSGKFFRAFLAWEYYKNEHSLFICFFCICTENKSKYYSDNMNIHGFCKGFRGSSVDKTPFQNGSESPLKYWGKNKRKGREASAGQAKAIRRNQFLQ